MSAALSRPRAYVVCGPYSAWKAAWNSLHDTTRVKNWKCVRLDVHDKKKSMQVVRMRKMRKGGGTAVGGCVPEEAGDEVVDGFRGVLHGHLRQRRPQGQLLQYTSKWLKQNKVGVALTVQ
jgi:hypothetical protein